MGIEPMHKKHTGFLAVIISGVIFGCMPLLAKIIYQNGGNAINLVFWRFFISIIPLYIVIKRNKKVSLKLTKREIKQIILLGTVGYSGTALLLFLSYNYITTGMATTLHFVYPIFVILGCALLYKEKITRTKAISVILCSFGILMLYDGNTPGSLLGIILAFASGITYAFYVMYIDKSGLKFVNPIKLTLYLSIVGSIIMFGFSMATGQFTMNLNPIGWLFSIILSLATSLGATTLLSVGIKLIGAQSASILSTLEPITSVIIGVIVFGEKLGLRGILACLFIIVSVVIIAAFDKENQNKEKEEQQKQEKQRKENMLYSNAYINEISNLSKAKENI